MIDAIHKDLVVFRDDIYPFLGGGNKARKIRYIEKDIDAKGCNAVVTTGGIHSNHCRAMALLAAQRGWKCTLVLHGDKTDFATQTGNPMVMRLSGAEIVFAEASGIGAAMDAAMEKYKSNGLHPYYVWGGGHTPEGGLAYIESIAELKSYCEKHDWYPKYLFLASGTGSTQAGILAGLDRFGLETEVIGISIARGKEQAEKIVSGFYEELCHTFGIEKSGRKVVVSDDYRCGGYEQFNPEVQKIAHESIKNYGFALDTTYTAKAFYGMQQYIGENKLEGNVLFWHTGGIFNFLAQKI